MQEKHKDIQECERKKQVPDSSSRQYPVEKAK